MLQPPQFCGERERFTSHPSKALWLQSAKPTAHSPTRQNPSTQRAVALG